MKSALRNRLIENVFLIGLLGTRKTTKWILESHFKGISVYVNCWKYRSTHDILCEILRGLGFIVHGIEYTSKLITRLEKLTRKKSIIVCSDEVGQLKNFDILYTLARNECGLILISTSYHALMDLVSRIKSSLALTEIEFPAYKPEELFDLMKDKVKFSFKPGTITKKLIRIASMAVERNTRIGLEILGRVGRKAESKGLKVPIKEIKQAIREAEKLKKSYFLSKLNEH